jgi:hypothetical protein
MTEMHVRALLRLTAAQVLQAEGLSAEGGSDPRPRGSAGWPVVEVYTPSDDWLALAAGGSARRTVSLMVRVRTADPAGVAGVSQNLADEIALRIERAIMAAPEIAALGSILSGGTEQQFSDRGDVSVVSMEISFAVVMLTAASNPAAPR